MFHIRRFSWVVLVGVLGTFSILPRVDTSAAEKNPNDAPRLFVLDLNLLATAKQRLQSGDNSLAAALNKLRRDADRALTVGNLSVTQKELKPPSGDERDYLSIAPYWWPNPNTTTGLPYVRRDGQINPERDQVSDRGRLDNFVQAVKALGLAYFFTGNEAYAAHAAHLLRAWFIDEKTRMNPHLRYAQSIPGRNHIRGAGIIETHNLPELLDIVALVNNSPSWTQTDQRPLKDWFNVYLNWLLESSEGKAEAAAENNHATWYDVQVASYALFAGRDDLAKKTLSEFSAKRIAKQIASDGRQRRELTRAESWHYSLFNLEALFDAASMGEKAGIDLWNFETPDKRGIRRALDWLRPFATGKAKWPYKDISGFQPEKLAPLLQHAAIRYREPAYEEAIAKLAKVTGDERWQLIYPKIQGAK